MFNAVILPNLVALLIGFVLLGLFWYSGVIEKFGGIVAGVVGIVCGVVGLVVSHLILM